MCAVEGEIFAEDLISLFSLVDSITQQIGCHMTMFRV